MAKPINMAKMQLQLKNGLEKTIDKIDSNHSKTFDDTYKNINAELEKFYSQHGLSKETIGILSQNPQFALGISDVIKKSDQEIQGLFQNYKQSLGGNLVNSYNTGFASRIWEAEVSHSIIFDVGRQPLPMVQDLLLNKEQFGYTLGERIKGLSDGTKKTVGDWLEASMLSGNTIKETTSGIRDIIGYNIDGSRVNGALARAKTITRTEMRRAYNTAQDHANNELEDLGIKSYAIWRSTLDSRTRLYHLAADSQYRGEVRKNKFLVGGEMCDHPQDGSLSAWNSINCRCYVEYTSEPNNKITRAVRNGEKTPKGTRQMPENMDSSDWMNWKAKRLQEMGLDTEPFGNSPFPIPKSGSSIEVIPKPKIVLPKQKPVEPPIEIKPVPVTRTIPKFTGKDLTEAQKDISLKATSKVQEDLPIMNHEVKTYNVFKRQNRTMGFTAQGFDLQTVKDADGLFSHYSAIFHDNYIEFNKFHFPDTEQGLKSLQHTTFHELGHAYTNKLQQKQIYELIESEENSIVKSWLKQMVEDPKKPLDIDLDMRDNVRILNQRITKLNRLTRTHENSYAFSLSREELNKFYNDVSEYARQSNSELWAETFAEYYKGTLKEPYLSKFLKVLNETKGIK